MKCICKQTELEKNYLECGISDAEIQIWHIFVYRWILTLKSMKVKQQSIEPQRLDME